MKKVLMMSVVALGASVAQADVALNLSIGMLTKADGVTPLETGSTLALIADADRDGFGDLSVALDSWTSDDDDILLARFEVNEGLGLAGTSANAVMFPFDGLVPGDPLLLVWYDGKFDGSAQGPGPGVAFGTFRNDAAQDGANAGWLVPADGATVGVNFVTASLGGSNDDNLGRAQFETIAVPEPTSLALLGILGGTLLRRRGEA